MMKNEPRKISAKKLNTHTKIPEICEYKEEKRMKEETTKQEKLLSPKGAIVLSEH
jgi:hypothetical protein